MVTKPVRCIPIIALILFSTACTDRDHADIPPTLAGVKAALKDCYQGRDFKLYARIVVTFNGTNIINDLQATSHGDHLDITWIALGFSPELDQHGELIVAGAVGQVTDFIGKTQLAFPAGSMSTDLAVAYTSGMTNSGTDLIYGLWAGQYDDFLPKEPLQFDPSPQHLQLSGTLTDGIATTLTLDHHRLVSLHETLANTAIQNVPGLTDDQIRQGLTMAGQPTTPATISNFRAMMALATTQMKENKGPIITDLTLSDTPMEPAPRPTVPPPPTPSATASELAAPTDLKSLTAMVTAARATASDALASHDFMQLVAADTAVSSADVAVLNYTITSEIQNNGEADPGLASLDEHGLRKLSHDLQAAITQSTDVSMPGTGAAPATASAP